MELKHMRMEKEMTESNWRQRLESIQDRNKELTKDLESARVTFEAKKDQYDSDFVNLKIEKDRLERNLDETEKKVNDFKVDMDKALKEVILKD